VSERDVRSRRGSADRVELTRRPAPPPRSVNTWQVLAIVALIAATAGWTTAAVLALRDTSSAAVAAEDAPEDTFDPNATDEAADAPLAETHDVPELEGLLPTEVSGTALVRESWAGAVLDSDAANASMDAFLTKAGKTQADFQIAQAYDPEQTLDASVRVYHVTGITAAAIQDALIEAWKGDYPDLTISRVTLDGKEITKGGFGEDTESSYLYQRGDHLYDIEAADDKVATAALAALPAAGAAASPAASASRAP